MATIALQAAGNAIAPGFGGVLGAMVGGYLDNAIFFPPPDQKGPRLDDLKFLSGSEGSPLNFVLGTKRVDGTDIWKSPLIEHEEDVGGKGGPSGGAYTYAVDTAISICEGPIYRISRIWANGILIYNADADVSITSNQISVTQTIEYRFDSIHEINLATVYMDLTSPNGGPDLSRLRSGKNAVLTGFAAGVNNGTFRVISSSKNNATGISIARLRNAACITATSGATVTITQDLPEWSPNHASGFTFYTGTTTQLPDPLIETYEGTGNVSNRRGRAYVVISRLQLKDFGNSMPQMQFLVEQVNGTKTIASAISDIMLRSRRPAEDFDVTKVLGNMRGYNIRGPQPVAQQLRPLLLAYDIMTQEIGGVLHFISRTQASEVVVPEELLAAHESGSDVPRILDANDIENPALPVQVNVSYTEPALDWQKASQPYRGGLRSGASDNVIGVDLTDLDLTSSEAQDISRRIYWTAHANRKRVGFALPPSMMLAQENDVLVTTAFGFDWRLLVSKLDRGANYLLQGDSMTEEVDVLTFTGSVAEAPSFTSQRVFTSPEMDLQVIDIAPFRAVDAEIPIIYVPSCYHDPSVTFVGGGVYASDDDSNFTLLEQVTSEATMGHATGVLSGTGISVAYWDRKSTVNVKLSNGLLSNRTETEVLNGKNVALIGREVVGFALATLQGDGSYTLSTLLRGLCNTEDQLTTHVAGEVFVQLDAAGVIPHQVGYGDIGKDRYFKAVALGGILSQFTSQQQRIAANSLRHFSPCQVQGARDASGNLTLTCVRRTRAPYSPFGPASPPLLDTAELYEWDVLNDAETTVLRTLTSTTPTVSYSAANQTTDFGSAHAAVHVKVFQVSTIVGRSKAALAIV